MRRAGAIWWAIFYVLAPWSVGSAAAQPVESGAERPRLVVMVVVDQLASHRLTRWGHLLKGGFGRLMREGAYYPRARFEYADTETAPGHATVATGAWPNVHGLVANRWVDNGRDVYCLEDGEHGRSPKQLLMPTLADALRLATGGRARVVSLSMKDRAAITLGGQRPDAVAWYDEEVGRFVPGSWPGLPEPPAWLERAALDRLPQEVAGRRWTRLRRDVDYAAEAGPDDEPHEEDIPGLGRTFPRVLGEGATSEEWREAYPATPPALDALFSMAKAAIDEEKLGQRGVPDLLAVGVSSTDHVGHWFGPQSQEMLDVLLRVDAALGDLMEHAERAVGGGEVLFAVTADHGSMVTVEAAQAMGVRAQRVPKARIREVVRAALGDEARIVRLGLPGLYLSATPPSVDRTALRRRVAEAVSEMDAVLEAHAVEDVDRFRGGFAALYRRSLYPGRSPDVLFRFAPHTYVSTVEDGVAVGSGHGSPYVYDATVPIFFAGPGVRRVVDPRPHAITRLAPTVAALLGIDPPAAAFDAPLPVAAP